MIIHSVVIDLADIKKDSMWLATALKEVGGVTRFLARGKNRFGRKIIEMFCF